MKIETLIRAIRDIIQTPGGFRDDARALRLIAAELRKADAVLTISKIKSGALIRYQVRKGESVREVIGSPYGYWAVRRQGSTHIVDHISTGKRIGAFTNERQAKVVAVEFDRQIGEGANTDNVGEMAETCRTHKGGALYRWLASYQLKDELFEMFVEEEARATWRRSKKATHP